MKQKHYFQISLLLILFLLSMICETAAAEEIQSGSHIEINPLYESVISEKDFSVAKASPYSSYSDTFSNISSLQSYIKTQMLNRQANISFTYTGYDMNYYDDVFDWFETEVLGNGVYLHNGTPNQGDYLLYSVLGWRGSWYGTASKKQFSFNLYYTSTSSQENQLSSVLSSTVSGLKLSGKTDYQKVKAIYDYICSHVTYDYAGLDSGSVNSPQTWSAWKCLVKGTCVCQGYAALFYRMALYAGVDTRIITSYNHAWDITRVGNYYYNLDSTWDAGYSPSRYGYFLKSDKYFDASSSSHVRENNTYTNTNSSDFRSKYPVDPKDYVILNKITLSGASSVETKQTIKLTASFSPLEATNKNVSWSSSNTAAAKVSDSGVVTGVKAGTVTITASSKENPSISAKKTITVTPDDTIYVSKVTISGGTSVVAGEKLTLMATVFPENAENQILKWTSSNTAIAQVSTTGEVTGVKVGTAKITAESTDGSNKKATISITVKPVPVSEVQLTGGSSIVAGDKMQLFTTVLPENAANKTLKWKSSSTAIAKVSSTGEVTGVKAGTATITATAADGSGKNASITIIVKPVLVGDITLTGGSSVVIGKKLTLKATVSPKNAANKTLRWISSDTEVAQVSTTGVVTALKVGKTTITAEATDGSGKTAAIPVTVTPVMVSKVAISGGTSVLIGGELQLKSTVSPKNASDQTLDWRSSDTTVAQVSTTGLVTGINAGKAAITATAADGSGKSASITITVKPVLVSKITLTGGSSVVAGEKLQLMATVLPENAGNKTLIWTSSNTAVAQVSTTGVVTGVKSGSAKITAAATDGSGKKAVITITVKPVLVSNLTLSGDPDVAVGGQLTLISTISPENAEKKTLKWTSSKSTVAKVSTTGVVTGVKAGTATITAATTDGSGKNASITITVKPKATSVVIRNSAGSVITGTTVQTTDSSYQLLAATNPFEASDEITWSSGEPSIATVDANTGKVTAKKTGTVRITATTADGSKISNWVNINFNLNYYPIIEPDPSSDFVIENNVLVKYNGSDTVVTVPNGVTAIGEYAFDNCDFIKQITIPYGVTSIGQYAFNNCKSMTSITIPDSVTTIAHHAFWCCSGLKQAVLSDNIRTIDYFAFADCNSLETVTIPESIKDLDLSAFMSSKSLNFESDFRTINVILDRFYKFTSMTDAYGNLMYNPGLTLCYNSVCYGVSNPDSAAKSAPAKMSAAAPEVVPTEAIVNSFENKEASLAIGEKTILNYTLSSGTEAFIASSDETVVSVDSVTHEITAVNAGTAMVYLSRMNPVEILDTCVITVTEAGEEIPESVPSNGFTDKALTLEIGEKTVLGYAVTDGTDVFMGSTDESVVTVDGITHEITAQKAGSANIYLSGLDPVEILDMCVITVTEPEIVAADEPIIEPEAEVTAEPIAEPEAEVTAEPTAEPEVEVEEEPVPEPEAEVTEEPIPEPKPEVTEESVVEEIPETTEEPIILVTELGFNLSEIKDDVLEMTEEDVLEIGWDKVVIRPDGKTYEDVEFRSDNESSLKLEVKGDGIRLNALTEGEGELILKAKEGDVEKKITFIVHPVVKPEPEAAIVPETAAVE